MAIVDRNRRSWTLADEHCGGGLDQINGPRRDVAPLAITVDEYPAYRNTPASPGRPMVICEAAHEKSQP